MPETTWLITWWKIKFLWSYWNANILKANKRIGIIQRLSNALPGNSLLTIYKSFIRPHLDYCDIIYDQPNNESFCTKIEHIQYNAALAITGAIKGTSQTKLYKELGLEPLKFRRLKQVVNQNTLQLDTNRSTFLQHLKLRSNWDLLL